MLAKRSSEKRAVNVGVAVSGEKHNRCVMDPGKVKMVAETIKRKENDWFVRTNVSSDLVIQIGNSSSFHLHIIPMVSRSAYLNRLIFDQKNNKHKRDDDNNIITIQLHNFPFGVEIFEIIVKFCYGWKTDLTPTNIAPLHCASHFLEMTDDIEPANLISRTQSFLSFILFSSWKDTFLVLKTCEPISSFARDLFIQRRCSEAIAWKACINPQDFIFPQENDPNDSNSKRVHENWWFEDVSTLRIDHFIEIVGSMKRKGMKSEKLGSCIAYWTAKWLSRISFGIRTCTQKSRNTQVRKVIIESLIRVLPNEENSVSFNFLMHLLKIGSMMKIDGGLSGKVERRVALGLEQCQPLDLLVKNYGETETLYDVGIVGRVVEAYVSRTSRDANAKVFVVGRLMDGYLGLVARDQKLKLQDFKMLAESLPKNARYSDDNLYRAIDRYLKAHPNLTEEERKELCRGMEYHKLSKEAREHAMKNDRLPLDITTQFILLEQVNMAQSMVDSSGSKFRRSKGQMIINVEVKSQKERIKVHKHIKLMKTEVDSIRVELNKLQICKAWIKKMARRV